MSTRNMSSGGITETLAAIERARVVGVLDAWAKPGQFVAVGGGYYGATNDTCDVSLVRDDYVVRRFGGETLDAARAAAAKAIEAGEV